MNPLRNKVSSPLDDLFNFDSVMSVFDLNYVREAYHILVEFKQIVAHLGDQPYVSHHYFAHPNDLETSLCFHPLFLCQGFPLLEVIACLNVIKLLKPSHNICWGVSKTPRCFDVNLVASVL